MMSKKELQKRALSLALALLLVPIAKVNAAKDDSNQFTDVDCSRWSYDYIMNASEKGVMNGVGNNEFNPTGTLTYAEFYTILTRAYYASELEKTPDGKNWYDKYITVANNHGLGNGTMGGFNNLNNAVNRNEMAQIIKNVLSDKKYALEASSTISTPTDQAQIPENYRNAVEAVYRAGVITGGSDGSFDGTSSMTREQAATVWYRMDQKLNAGSDEQQEKEQVSVEEQPIEQEPNPTEAVYIYKFAYVKNPQERVTNEKTGETFSTSSYQKVMVVYENNSQCYAIAYDGIHDAKPCFLDKNNIVYLPESFIEVEYEAWYIVEYIAGTCIYQVPIIPK